MHRLILAMFSILCLFSNCKKNSDSLWAVKTWIAGTWELRSNSAGTVAMNFPPGNGNIYKYQDLTYEKYTGGMLKKRGTYRIVQQKFQPTGKMMNRIIYDNDTNAMAVYVFVENDRLMYNVGGYPTGDVFVRIPAQ